MRNIIIPALCAVALFGSALQAQAQDFDEWDPSVQVIADGSNSVIYDIMAEPNVGGYY